MTIRARRIYYSLAILLFLILAPVILSIANGGQWAGWRAGFVPTGVLAISTSPKATMSINGQIAEVTTKLTKRLRPGQYEILLTRQGYIPWTTLIRIKANSANVIGPVILFPTTLKTSYRSPASSIIVHDHSQGITIEAEATPAGWKLSPLWPLGTSWTITTAEQPEFIRFSPKQRYVAVGTDTQLIVTSPGSNSEPWLIDAVNYVFWGDRGDAVFYAVRGQQIILLDGIARTETVIAEHTSAGWLDHELWSTSTVNDRTVLYRQSPDALEPIMVSDFVGRWLIEPGPEGVLILRNQDNHQTVVYERNAQNDPVSLGVVDRIWWPDLNAPPLWQSGLQLYTLSAKGQRQLLERGPEEYQAVYWIVPRHILASQNGLNITIRSVSARQGRGTILTHQLTSASELLGVDRGKKVLVFRSSEPPLSVFTLSWE